MAAEQEHEEENMTKLVFACRVCEKMYKKPGMCRSCDVVLKPKAA